MCVFHTHTYCSISSKYNGKILLNKLNAFICSFSGFKLLGSCLILEIKAAKALPRYTCLSCQNSSIFVMMNPTGSLQPIVSISVMSFFWKEAEYRLEAPWKQANRNHNLKTSMPIQKSYLLSIKCASIHPWEVDSHLGLGGIVLIPGGASEWATSCCRHLSIRLGSLRHRVWLFI